MENNCINVSDFIRWLDVGHHRNADELCFSENHVSAMLKDFAVTNPAAPSGVTLCKDCRYGLPTVLFGRDVISCTEMRYEMHIPDFYCAYGKRKDNAK